MEIDINETLYRLKLNIENKRKELKNDEKIKIRLGLSIVLMLNYYDSSIITHHNNSGNKTIFGYPLEIDLDLKNDFIIEILTTKEIEIIYKKEK